MPLEITLRRPGGFADPINAAYSSHEMGQVGPHLDATLAHPSNGNQNPKEKVSKASTASLPWPTNGSTAPFEAREGRQERQLGDKIATVAYRLTDIRPRSTPLHYFCGSLRLNTAKAGAYIP